MFEYFKRKFSKLNGKLKIDTYPQYYEENGYIIKEEKDGSRYTIILDKNYNEQVTGIYNG